MHFKKEIREAVYAMYLNSTCVEFIAVEHDLTSGDVNEIIDYMNEIYN